MTDMITDQAKLAGGVTAVLERPGARLVYEVAGDGPAVVLIHGFGLDMRMWDPQAGPLAARFRVVRYDCRGFGASGPLDPAVPYTHAGDLVALLDHLDIGDAVLAGLSFGGRVALQAALAAPDRVRGLALLDAVLDGVPWDSRVGPGAGRGRPAGPGGRGTGGPRGLAGPPAVRRRARAAGPGRCAGGHGGGLSRAALAGPGPAHPGPAAHRRARAHRRAHSGRRRTA
jgi:pimeloyl-ACP methyl ester carboxylesterase